MNRNRDKKYPRLGLHFHQTFIPERHYISSLLNFADSDGRGGNLEISEKTGIPTGKSSGKVPAIIKYCEGMGLISIEGKGAQRHLKLTKMGRSILECDTQLGVARTQWLVHLHLCRRCGGSEIWFRTFGPGGDALGRRFTREQLDQYLSGIYGKTNRSLIGPLVNTYDEPAALKKTGVLMTEDGKELRRSIAPLSPEFANGYAGFLLALWETHFPEDRQVTVNDLEAETYWGRLHGWDDRQRETGLELIREKGAVEIDKQMQPWVLSRRADSESFWPVLFEE